MDWDCFMIASIDMNALRSPRWLQSIWVVRFDTTGSYEEIEDQTEVYKCERLT